MDDKLQRALHVLKRIARTQDISKEHMQQLAKDVVQELEPRRSSEVDKTS